VTFPTGSPAWSYQLVSGQTGVLAFAGLVRPVHPTQIYESMAALVCCAVALSLKPRRRPTGSSEAAGTPDRRRSVAGLPFLVFALGFTLFRVAEFFLRPRPLTATGPGWLYPALYAVIIVTVVAVLVRRTANGHDQGI
jgi:prolipoprotein diacylglyceryltransferase